jgi:hypothetical protein
MDLYITTNLAECNRVQIFPKNKSKYSKNQLRNIVESTNFKVPSTWDYKNLIKILIHRLNIQSSHIIFALDDGENIILDSQSIEVYDQLVYGKDSKLQKITHPTTCHEIWKKFLDYQHTSLETSDKTSAINRMTIVKSRENLVRLHEKIRSLENKLKSGNEDDDFLKEYQNRFQFFEKQLKEKNDNLCTLKAQNRKLVLQLSSIQAEMHQLRLELKSCTKEFHDHPEQVSVLSQLQSSRKKMETYNQLYDTLYQTKIHV